MAVRVAKRYHQRRLNFCVITFYDHQRAAITKALKAENLPSECVYNVDSFQGMCIILPTSPLPAISPDYRPDRRQETRRTT